MKALDGFLMTQRQITSMWV